MIGVRRLLSLLCWPMLLLGVSACEGILGSLYDNPPAEDRVREGFSVRDAEQHIQRLYVDVVSYKDWVYVDLHRRTTARTAAPSALTGAWDGRSGVSYHQVELPSTFHFSELLKTDSLVAAGLLKPTSPASKIFPAKGRRGPPCSVRPLRPIRGATTDATKI